VLKKVLLSLWALSIVPWGWADPVRYGARLAVVLQAEGTPACRPYEGTESRRFALKPLSSLKVGDRLHLSESDRLLVSLLADGKRYEITGPLQLLLTPEGLAVGPHVAEVNAGSQRTGLVAGDKVDLSKFGGASSRRLGKLVYVDEPCPSLALDLIQRDFVSNSLKVDYAAEGDAPSWKAVDAALVHDAKGRDSLILNGLEFRENVAYQIRWGEASEPQFTVIRIPEAELAALRKRELEADQLEDYLDVIEGYRNYQLFQRAEKLLAAAQKKFPDVADWESVWQEFQKERLQR